MPPIAGPESEHAVEALGASDHVHPVRLAEGGEMQARQLRGGFDAVATAGGEEHARVVERRQSGEPIGELDGRLVGLVTERRVGVELADLRGDGSAIRSRPCPMFEYHRLEVASR